MTHYLAGAISTGRTAELLSFSWVDLRECSHRLGVPIHLGSDSMEEARQEMNTFTQAFNARPKVK